MALKNQISNEVVNEYGVARGSQYNIGRTFVNTDTNISVKSEYTRQDYDYYRGYESSIRTPYEYIQLSLRAYDKVGIVRNVIELMSDFVCKGIRLVHPVASQERFFQQWFNHVNGYSVSERFTNYLYRVANVPVNITYGTIPVKIEKKWQASKGKEMKVEETKVEKRRVPLRYSFINPMNIEIVSPELAVFTGKPLYALRITTGLMNAYNTLNNGGVGYGQNQLFFPSGSDDEYGSYIQPEIQEALKKGQTLIPITGDNIRIYFYKKDDWKIWADSMIVPIIDDLILLDKLKLADVSALDGAISCVRLWKLGHLGDKPENSMIPTRAMINKVRNILSNNIGGGTMDLVWGPDIDVKETSTEVYKFLGKEKYEPTLSNIYEGLGVPFVDSAGGTTNNFIKMQTFIERLQYGRRILTDFWTHEIRKVQLAMGYKKPALVSFDQINLGDDANYKQFLLGLLDRDAISLDTVLSTTGFFSNIEKLKIQREYTMRDSHKMPPKASPYHNPQEEYDMKKLFIQQGGIAPSELGIELLPKKEEELTPNQEKENFLQKQTEHKANLVSQQPKFSPAKENGRPNGVKDASKRKQKTIPLQTKGFLNTFLWGCSAQDTIAKAVTPVLLEKLYNKPTVRSLTDEEFKSLEHAKLVIFANIQPFSVITNELITSVASEYSDIPSDIQDNINTLLSSFKMQHHREPTIDELRQIQSSAYSLYFDE